MLELEIEEDSDSNAYNGKKPRFLAFFVREGENEGNLVLFAEYNGFNMPLLDFAGKLLFCMYNLYTLLAFFFPREHAL